MTRWQPDSLGRLQVAALDLYTEQGFEKTTVAEIAARAGLTERTFFRYFVDKREVLFAGGESLRDAIVEAATNASASLTPLETLSVALSPIGSLIGPHREFSLQRNAVIAANPALQERELIKLSVLASALAQVFRDRGLKEPMASVVGETGIALFKVAFEQWVAPSNKQELSQLIEESLAELKKVTADS